MSKKLSIIIPVYNVEKYILPCLLSIFNQGLDENEYEVILINDGTPDNSLGVIEDLIQTHTNIVVIEQTNKGLSVARNKGMERASGEYLMFIDSDDLLIDNRLKYLLNEAYESKPDLIVADYIVMYGDTVTNVPNEDLYPLNKSEKSGSQLFLEDLSPNDYFVWRTIYRRQFLIDNKLHFIESITFEDAPFTQECFLKAKKCIRVTYPFYIYRRRHGSLSTTINKKSVLDINKVIEKLWELRELSGITTLERERLLDNLFVTFSLNMWYISNHKTILRDKKEIVDDLKRRVPDLKFTNGIKQQFVSILYRMMPYTYLEILSYLKRLSHNGKTKNNSMLS